MDLRHLSVSIMSFALVDRMFPGHLAVSIGDPTFENLKKKNPIYDPEAEGQTGGVRRGYRAVGLKDLMLKRPSLRHQRPTSRYSV
jgi:hypothetical protein